MLFASELDNNIREVGVVILIIIAWAAVLALYDTFIKTPREARLKLAAEETEHEKQRTEQARILAEVEKRQPEE